MTIHSISELMEALAAMLAAVAQLIAALKRPP